MRYFTGIRCLFLSAVFCGASAWGQTPEINLATVPIVHTTPGTKTTPITHLPYFIGERDRFGYNPRYTAAPVNFDPDNIPYIRVGINPEGHDVYGENTSLGKIQTLDAAGQWINLTSWLDAIKAQYSGWDRLYGASVSQDEQIIFDSSGDAYMVVNTWYNSTLGFSVLLYSKDRCRTWIVKPLPSSIFFTKLEQPEAWNDTGNPPVLYCWPYGWEGGPIYLITPTKTPSGLNLPPKVQLTSASDNTTAYGPVLHSGMGNATITKGDLINAVYLRNAPSPDNTSGTPQYIVTYNRVTKTITGPVFLGTSDSTVPDIHDGPAITIDSQGYLHVLIGSHGGRFKYTKSLAPNSITGGWTTPVFIGNTGDVPPEWTYVSLTCDKNDTLHVVGRYSGYCYYFGLWYMRKKAGQAWEENLGPLVMPFRAYYSCWYHKLTMDRQGRLFVSYIYYGDQYDRGSGDPYTIHPEIDNYTAKWPWEGTHEIYGDITNWTNLSAHEPCVIMSDDGGDHWRLALTTSLQVFFTNTFENALDGWTLNTSSSPISAVSSYTYNGHTITPRTGTTFACSAYNASSKKATRTIGPAQSGIFTGYLNMVENTNIGMIEIAGGGHSFYILANATSGVVSYRIDGTETATAIGVTTQTWHQVKFVATAAGLDGYWDGTLLFHSTLATNISSIIFGSEWATAPCGYDDFSFTPAATVSGQVTLSDFQGTLTGLPVTFELRTPGQPTALETDNTTLDALGNYSFIAGLTGTYDVTAKVSHWLRQKQPGKALPANGTATINFNLTNGDADGNNQVTAADLSIVLTAMDGAAGGSADLDGDGEVSSTDLAIVLTNMDRSGDP